jgi:hypothetical protein
MGLHNGLFTKGLSVAPLCNLERKERKKERKKERNITSD